MSDFKIEGPFPREYRTRDGRKAVVQDAVLEGQWPLYGSIDIDGAHEVTWTKRGHIYGPKSPQPFDLIAPWTEPGPSDDELADDDELTAEVITTMIALAAIEDGIEPDEDYRMDEPAPAEPEEDDWMTKGPKPEPMAAMPEGMTVRLWLAGMAMQGLMARNWDEAIKSAHERGESIIPVWADSSIKIADALIAADKEGKQSPTAGAVPVATDEGR